MDFGLSEEQRLLEESLRRFLEESAPTSRVREIAASPAGHEPGLWQALAELGVAGILIPEKHGGSGLGLLDAAIAGWTLGAAAAPVPFLSCAVMAPVAIGTAGTPAQQEEWLPKLASARSCIGMAVTESYARREGAGVKLRDGRLHGKALFALDAGAADAFLVPVARRALFLVPRDTPGLSIETLPTVDGTRRFAELVFEDAEPTDALGGPRESSVAAARAIDAGRVALGADVLGACDRALALAVDYAKERKQFGRPIASFQAVKHMCAEMVAAIEPARALLWYAAHAFDAVPEEASEMAALAKAHLSEVGTRVLRSATEVHGGIGFTDECDLQLWFKRVAVDRQLLGGPERLRALVARLSGWSGREPEGISLA
jgi:alkylation response protein AidB-like acyl-CoA dehydrogenase